MKVRRFIYMLGSVVISLAIVSGGSAFAANHPSSRTNAQTKAQWQQAIGKLRTPTRGCYHASYPAVKWDATKCLVAPNVPLAPRLQTSSGGPVTVGDGHDYSAQVTGKISKATGTFDDVSSGLTETGKVGNEGSPVANAFTLQLNSEFFSTPVCSGAAKPSKCEGWQQFVYAFHYSGHTNMVFMQYWLLYWDTTCPSGWYTYNTGSYVFCYANSPATSYGSLTAAELGQTQLVAKATAGGNDEVTLSSTSGGASSASNSDSKVDLASAWNTAEFGVFGDGGGAAANFSSKATLEAQTTLKATSSSAPTCVVEGFTGETNNLSLTKTPAIGTEPSPTMVSKQTNKKPKTASCAVAG